MGRIWPLIGCTCTIGTEVDVGKADACLVKTTSMYISVVLCFSFGEWPWNVVGWLHLCGMFHPMPSLVIEKNFTISSLVWEAALYVIGICNFQAMPSVDCGHSSCCFLLAQLDLLRHRRPESTTPWDPTLLTMVVRRMALVFLRNSLRTSTSAGRARANGQCNCHWAGGVEWTRSD